MDELDLNAALAAAERMRVGGDLAGARAAVTALTLAHPDHPRVWLARCDLAVQAGDWLDLEAAATRVLALRPGLSTALHHLAMSLRRQGRHDAALPQFRAAAAAAPDDAGLAYNCSVAESEVQMFEPALRSLERALALDPTLAQAHANRGLILGRLGRQVESVAAFVRAGALAPTEYRYGSSRLLALHYVPGITARQLLDEHLAWAARFALPDPMPPSALIHNPDPHRRLRVGLLSPNLNEHPVGYFLARLVPYVDPDSVTLIAYADHSGADARTAWFQARMPHFIETRGMSDAELIARLRADRIDVLIELAGHTSTLRIRALSARAAPVQASWAGYVGTTGVAQIDWLIADRHHVPPGEENCYVERVWRLPDGYVPYDPPAWMAAYCAEGPAARRGHVTFGCFNNINKVTPQTIEVWAKILNQVPRSRLVLRWPQLGEGETRQRFGALFQAHGLDRDRIDLIGGSTRAELAQQYGKIDIALDSFPYSGGLTTLEAMWMGAPVITFPGAHFAGRHSSSHLRVGGLGELVAADLAGYVAGAVALAQDPTRLARLRRDQRARMAASPILDGPRFAAHFTAMVRHWWQDRLSPGFVPEH